MSATKTVALWVAYTENGVAGTIRKHPDGYEVVMSEADDAAGTFPTMDIAKRALHARLTPGSAWPQFRQH